MQAKQLEIINPLGLHARAAAKLVQLSAGFASQITISKDDKSANAKSIMKVMMLAASRGSLVTLETEGSDEVEAMQTLVALIEDGIGELESAIPCTDWRSREATRLGECTLFRQTKSW